jgi:hypothetical protein
MTRPTSLPFTGDPEADALLAADPLVLLIGFALDQQVTVQKAFAGPLELRRRVGTLDPGAIAVLDPATLAAASAGCRGGAPTHRLVGRALDEMGGVGSTLRLRGS